MTALILIASAERYCGVPFGHRVNAAVLLATFKLKPMKDCNVSTARKRIQIWVYIQLFIQTANS